VASFGLYRGVGPGLAIGIAVVLVVELTFFPALLSIFGRAVFWPSTRSRGRRKSGGGVALAARVSGRPVAALVIGTAVLGALASSLVAYAPSGFDPGGYIVGSNSGIGEAVLASTSAWRRSAAPTSCSGSTATSGRNTALLDQAQDGLSSSGSFSSVTGALSANGVHLPPEALSSAYRRLGPPGALAATEPAGTHVDPFFYNAYPGDRRVHQRGRAHDPLPGGTGGGIARLDGSPPGHPIPTRRGGVGRPEHRCHRDRGRRPSCGGGRRQLDSPPVTSCGWPRS